MILGGILMIVFHILQISGENVQDIAEGNIYILQIKFNKKHNMFQSILNELDL